MIRAPAFAIASLALLAACVTDRAASPGTGAALAEAERSLAGGDHEQAIRGFRQALAASPESPEAMRGLVEAHFRAGLIGSIVAELEQRLAARPDDAAAHYGLGLALYARSADGEARAVEHLRRACELRPEVAEYHFRLGVVHLDAERYGEAVESLRRARDLAPSLARHHVPLALALARTGDRPGAIASLKAILELSPEPHDVEVARKVMARLNDPFREFPKAIEAEFERGLDYMQRADAPQQAAVTFQEILDRFPDLAVVHAALGLCFQRLDDSGRAMDEYRRALELAPDDPLNHLYVADLYFAKERFERAAESYREVLARDPLSDRAYERLGQMALQRGDPAEAARWLKLLVVLRPDDLDARKAYAMALLGSGALDDAERQLSAILERAPKDVEALLRLGMLHLERQKLEADAGKAKSHAQAAVRCFEKVLDIQPENVLAARLLTSIKP